MKVWGALMSNLGVGSGHFSRHVENGKSCQAIPATAPAPPAKVAPAAEEVKEEGSGPEEHVDDPVAPPATKY